MSAFMGNAGSGGTELMEAMQRRQGIGGAASQAVSPGSPTYDPNTQPPQVSSAAPMSSPSPMSPPTAPGQGQAPGQPMSTQDPNTKVILGAMKDYLGHITQMEASSAGKPYGS